MSDGPAPLRALARACVRAGLGAARVTGASLGLAVGAGVALALGHFAIGGALAAVAALGATLDGLVARTAGGTGRDGFLGAVVDRYGEFFVLGGLVIHYRATGPQLALVLVALLGSFMVGYGAAKAEALRVPFPLGSTGQAERAFALCGGALLSPVAGAVADGAQLSPWVADVPLLAVLAVVGLTANVSAVRRLGALARAVRAVAMGGEPPSPPAQPVARTSAPYPGPGPEALR